MNVGLLLVLYVFFAYGVASILRFTGRRIGEQLAAAVDLLARAIPLLLLFSIVLFINTEMWQVFAGMNGATVVATAVLLALVGSIFLGVRLPREVARLEREIAGGPPLQRSQRINVGLVLFVTQALQIVLVALAVSAFFTAFGALVIPADVIESWTGTTGRQILAVSLGDIDVRVTVELLRVSAGIAALSGLYYSVAVLTDSTYREEFLEELTDDLSEVFADRARYLELRGRRPRPTSRASLRATRRRSTRRTRPTMVWGSCRTAKHTTNEVHAGRRSYCCPSPAGVPRRRATWMPRANSSAHSRSSPRNIVAVPASSRSPGWPRRRACSAASMINGVARAASPLMTARHPADPLRVERRRAVRLASRSARAAASRSRGRSWASAATRPAIASIRAARAGSTGATSSIAGTRSS